jgi:peptide deformylase
MSLTLSNSIAVPKKKVANPPLTIHKMGDRVLRQNAKRIAKVDDELRQTIRDMLVTMYSSDGLGLAAPQVGIQKQLIVIDCEFENPAIPPLVLINPTIEKLDGKICKDQEGCLSVPGVYMDVERRDTIELTYKDERGKPCRLKADGLLSRAIQHEIDHLNGVLFVDRINDTLSLTTELKKHGFSIQSVQAIR